MIQLIDTMDGARQNVRTIVGLNDKKLTADVATSMDTLEYPEGGFARFLWKAALRELAQGEGGEPTALGQLANFNTHKLGARV